MSKKGQQVFTKSVVWVVVKLPTRLAVIGKTKPTIIFLESETKGRIRQDGREVIKHGDSWFYVVE